MSTDTLATIPVAKIHPHPDNPRADLGAVDELAASIGQVGLLDRLIVVPNDDGYRLLAGHRRLSALKKAGKAEAPSIIRTGLTPEQEMHYLLIENIQRERLLPSEEALAYSKLIGMGTTMADLVKETGNKKGVIQARLGLLELPKVVRALVDNEDLAIENALKIRKWLPQHEEIVLQWALYAEGYDLRIYKLEDLISRDQIEREHQANYDKLAATGDTVFTDIGDLPNGAQAIIDAEGHWKVPNGLKFMAIDPKVHRKEPCHASLLILQSSGYAGKPRSVRLEICTDPKKHSSKGESRIKKPKGSQTRTEFERAVRATEKENSTRLLDALTKATVKAANAMDLVLDGTIDRCSSDTAKAVALIFGWTKDDIEPRFANSVGYGYKLLMRQHADKSAQMRLRVAYAVELAELATSPIRDKQAQVRKLVGFEPAPAPKAADFDE